MWERRSRPAGLDFFEAFFLKLFLCGAELEKTGRHFSEEESSFDSAGVIPTASALVRPSVESDGEHQYSNDQANAGMQG